MKYQILHSNDEEGMVGSGKWEMGSGGGGGGGEEGKYESQKQPILFFGWYISISLQYCLILFLYAFQNGNSLC